MSIDTDIDRDAVESALSKWSHPETTSLWELANLYDAAKAWLHSTTQTPTAGLGWRLQSNSESPCYCTTLPLQCECPCHPERS